MKKTLLIIALVSGMNAFGADRIEDAVSAALEGETKLVRLSLKELSNQPLTPEESNWRDHWLVTVQNLIAARGERPMVRVLRASWNNEMTPKQKEDFAVFLDLLRQLDKHRGFTPNY